MCCSKAVSVSTELTGLPEKLLKRWRNQPAGVCLQGPAPNDYRALVAQFGLLASMSRRGNCYDNAPMESFWGSLKNELVHHHRFATHREAQGVLQEYIEIFYNRQRRHSRLGYLAPAVFEQRYYEQAG